MGPLEWSNTGPDVQGRYGVFILEGVHTCPDTALCSLMQLPAGPALSRGLDQVIF